MRLHYLQHVPFEDIENIGIYAHNKGYNISKTSLFKNEQLPNIDEFDWLLIMGGPMNIYEEQVYPWLKREKKFIESAINNKKVVIGTCLGAQLIADVLGAKVIKNKYKEIGWFQVSLTSEAKKSKNFKAFPKNFIAFHWHGDTFEIPVNAIKIAESKGCSNQAFEYNGHAIGLQFHLESSIESINRLIQNCNDELVEGKYIQKPVEMIFRQNYINEINNILNLLLNNIAKVK